MILFSKVDQIGNAIGAALPGRRVRLLWLASLAGLCIAVATGPVLAKPRQRAIQPKRYTRSAKTPKAKTPTAKTPAAKATATSKPGCGSKARNTSAARARRSRTPQPSPRGPHPRITFDETEVVLDPVWKGEMLDCTFVIRNEGDAVLEIRAAGG